MTAAQLGRTLDGNVAAHEPDEGGPDGERLSAMFEDGAGGGGEPPLFLLALTYYWT